MDLEIDLVTGDIVDKKAEIVTVYQKDYTPDAEVSAIMQKYEDKVAPIKAEEVGESKTPLDKGYPSASTGDSALGNLIADGMKAKMDFDFSLMNGGGVRANLDAGKVTFGYLFSIQPFGNVLNKVKLSGSDLETVLNTQISVYAAADGTKQYNLDFHVAGFKYTWDGKTGKVVDIFLPDGTRIDKNKEYTVVVNNYMYGNVKYGIKDLATDLEVGPEDLQATVDYVKSLPKPFEYKAEDRIKQLVPLAAAQ